MPDDRRSLLEAAEERMFEALSLGDAAREAPSVWVLGSPRTGSTLCYQLLASVFALPYLSNFVNVAHPTTPALGVVGQAPLLTPELVGLESAYGKTAGILQPSE